jgi:competence protein ComEA
MICVLRKMSLVAVVAVVGAALLWHPPPRPSWSTPTTSPSPAPSARWSDRPQRLQNAVVYVVGAVRHPGLYALHDGARAAEAVARAGGLRPDADAGSVNLAERMADGDEVEVAAQGERVSRSRPSSHRRRSVHTRSRHSGKRRENSGGASDVDVNLADAGAIAAVPGIGRSLAERIVELRERAGPFATLDELLDVAGMTQSRLERARPYLHEP